MKHAVLKPFIDKESGEYYASDSFFECDDAKRVTALAEMSFIKTSIDFTKKKSTRKKVVDENVGEGKEGVTHHD